MLGWVCPVSHVCSVGNEKNKKYANVIITFGVPFIFHSLWHLGQVFQSCQAASGPNVRGLYAIVAKFEQFLLLLRHSDVIYLTKCDSPIMIEIL